MWRHDLTWAFAYILLLACGGDHHINSQHAGFDASTDPVDESADSSVPSLLDASVRHDAGMHTPPDKPQLPLVALFPEGEDLSMDCANMRIAFDFDAKTATFDVKSAFWGMWFAERAMFHDDPNTPLELASVGFDKYQIINWGQVGLQAYIAASPRAVVLAFRGSTEAIDWLDDFNFPQVPGSEHGVTGKVHQGFAGALEPGWAAISKIVPAFVDRHQPVWVVGHSLGAALTTLAAVRLASEGVQLAPVYTFAGPRVGDEVFAKAGMELLHGKLYRIVNEEDLVPRLPPSAAAAPGAAPIVPLAGNAAAELFRQLDYLHVGQMYWFEHASGDALKVFSPMDDSQDVPYWATTGMQGPLGLIAKSAEQGHRHAPQRYLCRLLAAVNAAARP
jgi:hypothetical protein